MDNGLLLILVGIIGVGVGFALGMGVASLRSVTPEANKKAAQPAARAKPVAAAPREPQPASVPAETGTPANPPVEIQAGAPVQAARSEAARVQADIPVEVNLRAGGMQRPNMSPLNVISRALQADVRTPDTASKSIAAQVDEILQEMLKNSPLAARAIKLMELPGKGMVVMVGLDQYDGVDQVPDDEIRVLIRSAAAEWERQATQSAP